MWLERRSIGRVLLVDDSPGMVNVWARELTRAGKEALKATNKMEAIAHARATRPDLAIVDLHLGSESGICLVRDLKAIDEAMLTVVVSAYMTTAYAMAAVAHGANYCVAKPMHCREILDRFEQGVLPWPDFDEAGSCVTAAQAEWEYISRVLLDCNNNISEAARRLGMHLTTLRRKLEKRGVIPLPAIRTGEKT